MDIDLLAQAVVSGILIGGLYAIMSMGISLSWGALEIINLAHFSVILLSAYVAMQLTLTFGVDPFLMVLIVPPAAFVVGMALQLFFQAVKVDEFKSLIITFGIFIIFQSVTNTIWTANFVEIGAELNPYKSESITVGGIVLQIPLLLAFVSGLAIAVGMSVVLSRTYFGKAVRAVVQDPDVARAFGIDPRRVGVVLSGLATAFSGLAGVFIAIFQSLSPNISLGWFGIVFPIVILGGLGNTMGALWSGVIVGVAAGVATVLWGPLSAPLVTFLILILALLFRPEGLFTRRGVA